MGRRNFPPRLLKLLQEQPPRFRCLPPRILKLQHEHQRFLPPRILKLQQQKNLAMRETERYIIPPRMFRLQEDKLQQLETDDIEEHQDDIFRLSQTLEDEPRAFLGGQEGWIEVGIQLMPEKLQERQPLEVEINQTSAEREYQSKLEQNLVSEPIIDYARLTSFLEHDCSFLTPWNWNKIVHS